MQNNLTLEKLATFCKTKGFIYPSSEIYGGFAAVYDYGHYGILLKNNIQRYWEKSMVQLRDDVMALDSGIFMHPKTWTASGHLASFDDVLVEDKKTNTRYRADHLIEAYFKGKGEDVDMDKKTPVEMGQIIKDNGIKSPDGNELTEPRSFNLMIKSNFGNTDATFSDEKAVYPRGETCQGIYLNYKNVLDTLGPKLPFGIAQVGKAFRNEIIARQFIFRTREFEQMEMQYFLKPEDMEKYFNEWFEYRWNQYILLGIPESKLLKYKHQKLAHYATEAYDIKYSFGCFNNKFDEVEGIHARGDWDLSRHSQFSGEKLDYFDEISKTRFTPHVMETSAGLNRHVLMHLDNAYTEEIVNGETRIVLKLSKILAPIKIAVLPLSKKEPLSTIAKDLYKKLRETYMCEYDETQSIGKRYRRQDEIGTPYCVTVDFETPETGLVTVRDRDTMLQEKVTLTDLAGWFSKRIN